MPSSGLMFTVAGTGEAGYAGDGNVARRARLNQPFDVALDHQGNVYFSEAENHCVRRVERGSGMITTVAGTGKAGYGGDGGPATQAQLNSPYGIALDATHNVYIVDRLNACIRMVEAATGIVRTIAGTGQPGYGGDGGPAIMGRRCRPPSMARRRSPSIATTTSSSSIPKTTASVASMLLAGWSRRWLERGNPGAPETAVRPRLQRSNARMAHVWTRKATSISVTRRIIESVLSQSTVRTASPGRDIPSFLPQDGSQG